MTDDATDNAAGDETGFQHLRSCYAAGDLVLHLGAGVSLSAGLPGWEALLHQLAVEMWQERVGEAPAGDEAEAFARLFRRAFGGFPIISGRYVRSAFGARFQERVRALLYAQPDASSPLLESVTRLCIPERGSGGVPAVVTYNYDDLLEEHLRRFSVRFHSIYAEGQPARPNELPIYHVHGYLPRRGRLDSRGEIVFAEDAYHTQFLDPYGWANITQLNLLREKVALFIGFSMTDPNLRRILDVAHRHERGRRHYVIMKSAVEEELGPADAEEKNGRRDAFVSAFRSIQEEALADLGLHVLWIDEFDEVPLFLDRLRVT